MTRSSIILAGSRWALRLTRGLLIAAILALLSPLPVLWSYASLRRDSQLTSALVTYRFRVLPDHCAKSSQRWPKLDRAILAYVMPFSRLAKSSEMVDRFYSWYLGPLTRIEVPPDESRIWPYSIGVTR